MFDPPQNGHRPSSTQPGGFAVHVELNMCTGSGGTREQQHSLCDLCMLQAKAAQQQAEAAAARDAAFQRGRSIAAALLAIGAIAGLQLAAQQTAQQKVQQDTAASDTAAGADGAAPPATPPGLDQSSGSRSQQAAADAAKLDTAMERMAGVKAKQPLAINTLRR